MLQHIALTISDSEEIENFYEDILLFNLRHKFSLSKGTSMQFFNIEEKADVYVMEHHNTQLEIFLSPGKERKVFSHICLAYWKAEIAYKKAVEHGYKALVKMNPVNNTCFIWDKSGNMFEIKHIQE